jgi:hypothetical protein
MFRNQDAIEVIASTLRLGTGPKWRPAQVAGHALHQLPQGIRPRS